jgi:Flp pilus assembly protein TadB
MAIEQLQNSIHFFLKELNQKCKMNGIEGVGQLWISSAIEGAALFLIVWSVFLYLKTNEPVWNLYFAVAWGIPFLGNVVWQEVMFEKQTNSIEKQIPDSLMIVAALPQTTPFEKIIQWLSETTPQPIRKEWKKVFDCIQKGQNIQEALRGFGKNYVSSSIPKVKHLLIQGYEKGSNIQLPAAKLANHLLDSQTLVNERKAALMIEKYTLLLAGGMLVPLLLGLMVGVVSQLPFGNVLFEERSNELFGTALQAIHGYLFIYSVLGGVFVGVLEGRKWQGMVYVLLLIPSAQIAYSIGQWWASM